MDKQNRITMEKKMQDKKAAKEDDLRKEKDHLQHFPYTGCESYHKRAQANYEKLNLKE